MPQNFHITRMDNTIPWGFRLRGGKDIGIPLSVCGISLCSVADVAGVCIGMKISSINGKDTDKMTHKEVQDAIAASGSQLEFKVVGSGPDVVYPPSTTMVTGSFASLQDIKQSTSPISALSSSPTSSGWDDYATARSDTSSTISPPISETGSTTQTKQATSIPMDQNLSSNVPNINKNTAIDTTPKHNTIVSQMITLNLPDTTNTPVCFRCNNKIRGPFIDTGEYCFCQDHFNCHVCNSELARVAFSEKDGKFYCEKDFLQYMADRCAGCKEPIKGIIASALGKTWHPECFVCYECKKPVGSEFHLEEADRVLCREDWIKKHCGTCSACGKTIGEIDRFIEAFGKQFHPECFRCAACKTSLEGQRFHAKGNNPFCLKHGRAPQLPE